MMCASPGIEERDERTCQSPLEQGEPLLRTKLFAPPARPNRVARPRLVDQLNSGLDKALILVSAPAGYGKTTLVSNWLRGRDGFSAWLSLDEDDNDPSRFLRNLVAALRTISPTIRSDLSAAWQVMQPDPYETLLNILINEVAERASSFVLALDDFQVIHALPILKMVTFLIEHAPPQMHLVLLSRTDPLLPLFRLRTRDQMVEIRAQQLRFTREEIAVFVNEVMGLRLSLDDIAALEMRTEGWIAGLQLAALSMRGCEDISGFMADFSGSHHYIVDFLTEEVLKLQTETVRSFLLHTSILNSMCASLCDAVTGNPVMDGTDAGQAIRPDRDSQSILEYLERSNLFVVPLDERRKWYRYHHLFADVLKLHLEHLSPHLVSGLHQRASEWYEQNEIIPEATHHALLANDQARAARLVEEHGCSLLMRGEGFTLLKWVDAVEAYSRRHPWLAVLRAWALALTGDLDQVEPALQAAAGLATTPEDTLEFKIVLGSIAAVRAYVANLNGRATLAMDHAQEALEYLPVENVFSCTLRGVAVSILGDASRLAGDLESAVRAYLESVQISQSAGNIYMTLIAKSNLAESLVERGELRQAARIYREILPMATRPDGQKLPLADRIHAGLAGIAYERNQLETAAQHIHACIELCEQWGNTSLLVKAHVLSGWLERAAGNLEKARAAMRAAEKMAGEKLLSPRSSVWAKHACAHWWIAQGELERAGHFVEQCGETFDGIAKNESDSPQRVPEHLLLIRLRLAQGDYDSALSLSERLLPVAEASNRTGRIIEVLLLMALALQGKRDMGRALTVLGKALSSARPESYVRTFLDEGEPMFKLLYQAKSHRVGGEYTSELLATVKEASRMELPPDQLLIEPLTPRELEVLGLIRAGCSNPEIADRLVISVPTVKRHISNIYAKLGVSSRMQAVSAGAELRLLD